jgi:hypothetical protein
MAISSMSPWNGLDPLLAIPTVHVSRRSRYITADALVIEPLRLDRITERKRLATDSRRPAGRALHRPGRGHADHRVRRVEGF